MNLCTEMDSKVPRLASALKKRKATPLRPGGKEVRGLGLHLELPGCWRRDMDAPTQVFAPGSLYDVGTS